MGCPVSKNGSKYKQVADDTCNGNISINLHKTKTNKLQKHHSLSSGTICTISTQDIRKIFCYFIRGSDLQKRYFTNIQFSYKVIELITYYIDDFFKFHSYFKYSQILLSNNDKTATILTTLLDHKDNYSKFGDRLILFGLPIFPRKDFIYCLHLKIDKCSTQTIAISFISDYTYFKLNYLQQNNCTVDKMHDILDSEILGNLPIKYGSYTIWCNGKETKTWNHCKKKSKWSYNKIKNYLEDYINFDFADDDNNAMYFTDGGNKKIGFKMFDTVKITINGFKNVVIIENGDATLTLNIPNCYKSCVSEEGHYDKVDNLNHEQYYYKNSKDKDCFIYPLNKDKMADNVLDGDEHNPQFQIAFVLYDGDTSHGQISIVDQSWSYLT